jgi:hypothetical protein
MSVHAGHVDVRDEYRDLGIGFRDVERCATATRRDYVAAEVSQHVHSGKLRADAAECALIRDIATDLTKRDLFDRLAHMFRI